MSVNSSSSTAYPDSASSTVGATASDLEGSSLPSGVSPSPIVSPLSSQNSSGVLCSTTTLNPLLKAGLIPPDLVVVLATPPTTTEPTKRITGARELTTNEYYKWLKAEQLKKKEAAEAKQRKAEERQRRKREREEEQKHKQDEREKKKQLAKERIEKQTSQK